MTERGHVRIRHYTSRSGSLRIEADGVIRTGAHGAIFCENARRRARAPHDAETFYRLDRGTGRDYVEVDVPREWIERRANPLSGVEEWMIRRDIALDRDATIVRRR